MKLRALLPSLALFLYGCAGAFVPGSATSAGVKSAPYPSLARRPIETRDFDAPAAMPVPVSPVTDPALDADLARLNGIADTGRAAFDRAFPEAERSARAATRASVSSDAWIAAQVAISGLEAARNDCVSALANLDTLYTERVKSIADGKVQGGDDRIAAARTAALATVDSQNDRLDALKALLPQA